MRRVGRVLARAAGRRPALSDPRPLPEWSRFYGRVEASSRERRRSQAFDRLTSPTTLVWVDGISVRLHPKEQLSRALYVSGTYEPNTLVVLRNHLAPGDVFIDVGAHIGVVSLAAAKWVGAGGRVVSFEPSSREHRRLAANVERSRFANVATERLAVGDRSGTATLKVADDENSGLNTLGEAFAYAGVPEERTESVGVVTLDEYAACLPSIAAIKVDAEGAEARILRGASKILAASRPLVVLEVNHAALVANGSSPAELEQLLGSAGYHLFEIADDTALLRPSSGLAAADGANVVAVPEDAPPPDDLVPLRVSRKRAVAQRIRSDGHRLRPECKQSIVGSTTRR